MAATNEPMYRFQATVPNVYKYMMHRFVTTLASYKNQVSGWVKESELLDLGLSFPAGTEIKAIPAEEYWANYDFYEK